MKQKKWIVIPLLLIVFIVGHEVLQKTMHIKPIFSSDIGCYYGKDILGRVYKHETVGDIIQADEWKIIDANGDKFKVIEKNTNPKIPRCVGYDGKKVFLRGYELKGADINTLEAVTYSISKDKNSVWSFVNKYPDADPNTFELLEIKNNQCIAMFQYAKDKNHVYYDLYKLEQVDPNTFTLFCENGKAFGKDKNHKYDQGRLIN